MSLLSILKAGINAMIADATQGQSFKTGEAFEGYVRKYLFTDRYYTLVDKTHNYLSNHKDYVESSLKPDYTFRDHWTNQEFYIEAKFRSTTYHDKVVWCNQHQLKRYNELNKQKPVFVILGVGDNPSYPEYLFLIPIHKAKYTGLFPSYLEQFQIELGAPVTSKVLWNR